MVDALPLKPFMLFQYLDNEITDSASMLIFVFWCVSASASTEINDKKIKITPSWRNKIMHSFHKLSSQIAPIMATISANYTRRAPFQSLLQSLLTGKLPQETHVLQVIRRDTDLFTLTCWTWFLMIRNESTHLIMLVLTLILYNSLISIRGIIVLDEQSIKSTQM